MERGAGSARAAAQESEPGPVADAAQGIGQSFQGEGNYLAAAEFFMTAAYVAPESAAGRRALLGAGQSWPQPDSAAVVYRKLLAQPDLPPDLAAAARQGLAATGRQ